MKIRVFLLWAVAVTIGCGSSEKLRKESVSLAREIIIADGHVDTPYRLSEYDEDISIKTTYGNFDFERARQGGLDAPFMAIYVPAEDEKLGVAKQTADNLILRVESWVKHAPDKFALARTPADVETNFAAKKISFCMGMENGAPIEGKIENVKYFYDRGIRYITLTHGRDNHIGDSSYDTTRTWHGLSPFGKEVVREMNRVGIMIDISHVSDEVFFQVMELSKAPAIASHSSCRFFTPGFQRNMADSMIALLGKNDGVIMINFGSPFLGNSYRAAFRSEDAVEDSIMKAFGAKSGEPKVLEFMKEHRKNHPIKLANVTDVADHIDHVVKLVGINHVGLGSDFDGVGNSLPEGLKDVSMYPNLIFELLRKGYSKDDIEKIGWKNIKRVWTKVAQVSMELNQSK